MTDSQNKGLGDSRKDCVERQLPRTGTWRAGYQQVNGKDKSKEVINPLEAGK